MEKAASTLPPIWAWLFGIVSLAKLINFIWYGHQINQLVGAIGFGLMALAVHRQAPANLRDATPEGTRLYWVAMVGAIFIVASYILKYAIKI